MVSHPPGSSGGSAARTGDSRSPGSGPPGRCAPARHTCYGGPVNVDLYYTVYLSAVNVDLPYYDEPVSCQCGPTIL